MEIRKIEETLSVTSQIRPDQIAEVAEKGFRAIIGNRPDGEEAGQPAWAEIAAAAAEQGIEVRHIPVDDAHPVEMQSVAFASAMTDLPKPIIAFCRTGNRSAMLHAAITGASAGIPAAS